MRWLVGNWRELIPSPWLNIALAIVAVLCGSIVGAERERKEKPAGFRTLTLVSLGSAVFTMMAYAFPGSDPTRIVSQIVTGVGFLGAGAILRGNLGVTGMTTAAAIWVIAANGMVVGVGYAGAGLALSLLILAVLTIISSWEMRYLGRCRLASLVLLFDPRGGKTRVQIEDVLDEHRVEHNPDDFKPAAGGLMELRLNYCQQHRHHKAFLTSLAAFPEVREMRCEPSA